MPFSRAMSKAFLLLSFLFAGACLAQNTVVLAPGTCAPVVANDRIVIAIKPRVIPAGASPNFAGGTASVNFVERSTSSFPPYTTYKSFVAWNRPVAISAMLDGFLRLTTTVPSLAQVVGGDYTLREILMQSAVSSSSGMVIDETSSSADPTLLGFCVHVNSGYAPPGGVQGAGIDVKAAN